MGDIGEGAISRGPMVPVFRSADPEQVARALASFDEAGIPSIGVDRSMGLLVGPVPPGVTVVVVPLGLVPEARNRLEQIGLLASQLPAAPSSYARSERNPVALGSGGFTPTVQPTSPVRLPDASEPRGFDDEDDGPLELPPFETTSGQSRLTGALAACSLGALVQATLIATGRADDVRQKLALWFDGSSFHGNAVTAGLMHGSSVHFLSNLGFGLIFGYVLLGTHGLGATAAVWLTASILGTSVEALLSPGAAVLGASAGIYGLIGLWLRGELQRARRAVLPRRATIRALGIIILLAPGALTPITSSGSRVAVLAHLVGFAVGLLAGSFFPRWLDAEGRDRGMRRGRWAFLLSAMVMMGGLAAAFLAVQTQTF